MSRGSRQSAVDSAAGDGRGATGLAGSPEPRAASHSERVEATAHLVESGENYWTISRQYYGNGRYIAPSGRQMSESTPISKSFTSMT